MSKLIDIKGQRFGRLKVLRKSKDANLWVCRCSCGKIVEHSGYRLRNGCVKSCGCLKIETTRKLRSIDLTGKTFGRWTVLEYRAGGYCLCRCTCGRKKLVLSQSLRDGRSQSCGCLHKEIVSRMNFLDLTGRSFGRLTVIDRAPNQKRRVYWNCQCSCGSLKAIQAGLLIDGRTQSCGCLRREWIEQNARRFGFKPGHRMAPEMRAAVNRKFRTRKFREGARLRLEITRRSIWCRECHIRMVEKKDLPKNWFDKHADVYVCPKCGGTDGQTFSEICDRTYHKVTGRPPRIHYTEGQLHDMLERVFIKGEGYQGAGAAFGISAQKVHDMLNKRRDYRQIVRNWKHAHNISSLPKRTSWLKGHHLSEESKHHLSVVRLGKEFSTSEIRAMLQFRVELNSYRQLGERFGCSDIYAQRICQGKQPFYAETVAQWKLENPMAILEGAVFNERRKEMLGRERRNKLLVGLTPHTEGRNTEG